MVKKPTEYERDLETVRKAEQAEADQARERAELEAARARVAEHDKAEKYLAAAQEKVEKFISSVQAVGWTEADAAALDAFPDAMRKRLQLDGLFMKAESAEYWASVPSEYGARLKEEAAAAVAVGVANPADILARAAKTMGVR